MIRRCSAPVLCALAAVALIGLAACATPDAAASAQVEAAATVADREFYELRAYHLPDAAAMARMSTYLATALLPALERQGIGPIGVFQEVEPSAEPMMYVLLPFDSAEDYLALHTAVEADPAYVEASRALSDEGPLYTRFSSSLLESFAEMPTMEAPPESAGLFELRIYESRDVEAGARKVAMFNEGEMPIFDATGLNRMFFGQALAGPDLPNLTYMLWFDDAEARDAAWDDFREHPDWIAMKDLPQYADTVSKVRSILLTRAPSSQL